MKQFSLLMATGLAILTLLCPGRARGQTANRPAQQLFSHLDRSRVPGRLLWPQPMLNDAPVAYAGHDDSVAAWNTREQLVASLQAAAFDSVPGLKRLATLRRRYAATTTTTVPLALLNYRYGAIKTYALDSALLVIDAADSTYRDGPNRRESPYAEQRLFTLAPLAGVSNHATVSFRFDADGLLTNRAETFGSYWFDCGDGAGWRPLTPGLAVQTTYPTTGPKTLRLRAISATTGDTLRTAATYYVARLTTVAPDLTGTLTTDNLPAQALPGCYDVGANGQFATAYWYTRFGAQNTSGQIRRPVIFVEGIDFGRELNYSDNATNHGEFGWDMFINGGGINQRGELDYQQLVEMPLLLQSLHDKGYDVVLLDFGWGADAIQKNAMTLVKLLTTLQQQGLDEPATVVGTSMGGLVSRYALAWMEQHNYPHCTRLWTSFDSPQNVDANVPLGMQHMINFFADKLHIADAESGQRRVRTPAAAQMLVYQAWDQSDCYRTQFANLLNSTGLNADHMPERLRRTAILNGSKLGVNQGFNAGDEIIHYEYNVPGISNQVFRSNVFAVPNSPGSASGQNIFDGRALNVNSAWNLTCVGGLITTNIALGLVLRAACLVTLNTNGPYFRAHISPGFPTEPYDNGPGGWSPFMKGQESDKFLPAPLSWVQIGRMSAVHDNACFIPVTSALGLRNFTTPNGTARLFYNLNASFPNRNHLDPNLTPFQAFYAPNVNEQHTQLTADNRNFALQQLSGNGNRLGGDRPVNLAGWAPSLPYNATSNGSGITVTAFNFTAQSFERQLHTVQVTGGGQLYVNRQGQDADAGVTPNVGFAPSPGTFVMTTGDCGATVTVNAGGHFELGTAGATATTGYKAEVQFLSGSVLDLAGGDVVIHSYSTLRMRAGSLLIVSSTADVRGAGQIIIERGARLEIRPGALIHLDGNEAVLDIKGLLDIKDNATFTFTGAGYVNFDLLPTPAGSFRIAPTGAFHLAGSGPNDLVARLEANSWLQPMYWGDFPFTIENGRVQLGNNAVLDGGNSTFTLANASFVNAPNARYRAIVHRGCGHETIHDCLFRGGETGLIGDLNGCKGAAGWYANLTFDNCLVGLHTIGKAATLVDCHFSGTLDPLTQAYESNGWVMSGASFAKSQVLNSTYQGQEVGIKFSSSVGSNLTLEQTQVHDGTTGIEFQGGGQLAGQCLGMWALDNTAISLSQGRLLLTQSHLLRNGGLFQPRIGGGTAPPPYAVARTLYLTNATGLSLEDGGNNLVGVTGRSGIYGTFQTGLPAAPGPFVLAAAGNRWNTDETAPVRVPLMSGGASQLHNFDLDVLAYSAAGGPNVVSVGPLEFADSGPMSFTESVSSARECGLDPCQIPVRDRYLPCNQGRPLASCPSCEKVTTSFVTNDSLHHAVLVALSYQKKYDPTSTDANALAKLREVLLLPLADTTAEEQRVLEIAYTAMRDLFATALVDSVDPAVAQLLYDVIDRKLANAPSDSLVHPEFAPLMDGALAAYSAGDLATARTRLAAASGYTNALTEHYYAYWHCFLDLTQQYQDSLLTVVEYAEQLGACAQATQYAGRGGVRETPEAFLGRVQARAQVRAQAQAARSAVDPGLSLVPNPATAHVTVRVPGSAALVRVTVRDVAGRPVRTWTRPAEGAATSWQVPTAGLPAGLYLVEAATATARWRQRLVVQP